MIEGKEKKGRGGKEEKGGKGKREERKRGRKEKEESATIQAPEANHKKCKRTYILK